MVVALHDEKISLNIPSDFVGCGEGCLQWPPRFAAITRLAGAGNGGKSQISQINAPDAAGVDLTEIECPIGAGHNAVGVVYRGFSGKVASLTFRFITRLAGSGDGIHPRGLSPYD